MEEVEQLASKMRTGAKDIKDDPVLREGANMEKICVIPYAV